MPPRRPTVRRRAPAADPLRAPAANPPSELTAPSGPAAPPTDDLRKRASMNRALNHFKSNVIAYLALFVALGGTSYAATTLGPGSVGTRQLQNHSVSPVKLQKSSIGGYVQDWAQISGRGHVIASRPHAHIADWATSGLF